jgi:hypothetical protein
MTGMQRKSVIKKHPELGREPAGEEQKTLTAGNEKKK